MKRRRGIRLPGASAWQRLGHLERVVMVALAPIWLVGFALHVWESAHGRLAWVGVIVAAPASDGGYPTVAAFQPAWGAEASGLRGGDAIETVGAADMRGRGPLRFAATTRAEAGSALRVSVTYLRDGDRHQTELPLRRVPSPWGYAAVSAGFALSGIIVALRAPRSLPCWASDSCSCSSTGRPSYRPTRG